MYCKDIRYILLMPKDRNMSWLQKNIGTRKLKGIKNPDNFISLSLSLLLAEHQLHSFISLRSSQKYKKQTCSYYSILKLYLIYSSGSPCFQFKLQSPYLKSQENNANQTILVQMATVLKQSSKKKNRIVPRWLSWTYSHDAIDYSDWGTYEQ